MSIPPQTAIREQQATTQLTPQQFKALAPQIGDTIVNADGKEITLDAHNIDYVIKNTHDFFVSKQDGTYYHKNKDGIHMISDGGGYTKNTNDNLASIKYSPSARDAWKASMLGDGNKVQQKALNSEINFFEKAMGPVPTNVEAAKILAAVLPRGHYTKSDLQEKYADLKAVANKTPEQRAEMSALGRVIFDPALFNKLDGIHTNGATDGSIMVRDLKIEANSI